MSDDRGREWEACPPDEQSIVAPLATVVIASKNRLPDLKVAVASALAQSVPLEVLVMDDGSTDGTAEAIRQEFPAAKVHRTEESTGYIVKRNLGAEMASTPFIFSIDDDAAFDSSRTVEQTLADFNDDRIAAVAIPYINVNYGPEVLKCPPDTSRVYVTDTFVGTSYAIRRDAFLAAGGYEPKYFHQVEEQDICAALLGNGQFVRLGTADPIHHFESPIRDLTRVQVHTARNNILFTWQHVPTSRLPVHWAGNVKNLTVYGWRCGHLKNTLDGLLKGFGVVFAKVVRRKPLSLQAYRLLRRLKRSSISLDQAVEALEVVK